MFPLAEGRFFLSTRKSCQPIGNHESCLAFFPACLVIYQAFEFNVLKARRINKADENAKK
jgi:hypothetical protein